MTILDNINMSNDFMFSKVMEDESVCKAILEKILNVKIEKIKYIQEQKIINPLADSKSVRLDVYVQDDNHTIYNVEMQNADENNLPMRSRYYQSIIDVNSLQKGQLYTDLNKSFIIFICTFDPFKKGRHVYTFTQTCKEDSTVLFDNKTSVVLINTTGDLNDIDDEFADFLNYIEHSTEVVAKKSNSSLVQLLHNRVMQIRSNKEMERDYVKLELIKQEERNKGMQEGIQEGIEKLSKLNSVLLSNGRIEDLSRALSNKELLEKLFKEFDI